MDIREITTPQDLEIVFPVIHELRPHLTFSAFSELFHKSRETDGYRIVALFQENQCVAAMGFRLLYDLVRGKHLYVDDLVTKREYRSRGLGAQLLRFAENEAQRLHCPQLRLCTGIENDGGKKFYEREGWSLRSVAYVKSVEVP